MLQYLLDSFRINLDFRIISHPLENWIYKRLGILLTNKLRKLAELSPDAESDLPSGVFSEIIDPWNEFLNKSILKDKRFLSYLGKHQSRSLSHS